MKIREAKKIVKELKYAGHGLHTSGSRLIGILHNDFTSYLTNVGKEFEQKAKRLEVLLKEIENNKKGN